MDALKNFRPGLVVSCQAPEGSPLRVPSVMAAMAQAAEQAGAVGIRAQGIEDIAAIRSVCTLPMIGIIKRWTPESEVYITPNVCDAESLVKLGVEVVATDMTGRPRPQGEDIVDLVDYLHRRGSLVMADVATLEQGIRARDLGADIVGTTLVQHLHAKDGSIRPNFEVLADLARRLPDTFIVAEGGYSRPSDVAQALDLGARWVVVGRAITDTLALASDFASAAATN